MLKIRLTRVGKKNKPLYRIIVTEHTNAAKGKYLEIIGHYNPTTKLFFVNKDKALKWMDQGAKPSNTVARFFEQNKLKHKSIEFKKFKKAPKSKKEESEKPINQIQAKANSQDTQINEIDKTEPKENIDENIKENSKNINLENNSEDK